MGLVVLSALPKLPLGKVLLYHIRDAGCIYVNNMGDWNAIKHFHYHEARCIYVNNVGPWNAIKHFHYHLTDGPSRVVLFLAVLSLPH